MQGSEPELNHYSMLEPNQNEQVPAPAPPPALALALTLSLSYLVTNAKKVQNMYFAHISLRMGDGARAGDGVASFSHSGAASKLFVPASAPTPQHLAYFVQFKFTVYNLQNISLRIGVGARAGAASCCYFGAE
jgi:hypothetical protein